MNLCDARTVKGIMSTFHIRTKKEFGQNFLINQEVPSGIADMCCDNKDSCIIEIGPGIGCLTYELATRYSKVVALEIDRGLLPVLAYTLGSFPNVTVLNEDVMKADLKEIIEKHGGGLPVSVCANLPYYITTPILMRLLELRIGFDSITIMVQKEVAARLAANAGEPDFGAITASLGYYGRARLLFDVTKENFLPPPKVDSAVVRIDLYKEKPYVPKDEKTFFRTIKAAFGQRRKTLANALSASYTDIQKSELTEIIKSLGFDENIRGERLSTKDFVNLSNLIFDAQKK